MPRINSMRWKVVSDHIFKALLACPVNSGRISKWTANAMAVQINCRRSVYEKCLMAQIADMEGVLVKYERIGSRAEGHEYRYTFLFTQDPERASQITLEDLE